MKLDNNNYVDWNGTFKFVTNSSLVTTPQFQWLWVNWAKRMNLDLTSWELVSKNRVQFSNTWATAIDGAIWVWSVWLINPSGLDIVGIWATGNRKINIFWQIVTYNNLSWWTVFSNKYLFWTSGTNLEINWGSWITVVVPDSTSKFRVVNPVTGSWYVSIDGSWSFERYTNSGAVSARINAIDNGISSGWPGLQVQSPNSWNTYNDFFKLVFNDWIWSADRGMYLLYLTSQSWNPDNCSTLKWTVGVGCSKLFSINSWFNWTTNNIPSVKIWGNLIVDNNINYTGDEIKLNSPVTLSWVINLCTLASAPTTSVNWQMYYDSTEGKNKCYEWGNWKDCGWTPMISWRFLENTLTYNFLYNWDFERWSGSTTTNWNIWTGDWRWISTIVWWGGKVTYDKTNSYKGSGSILIETTAGNTNIEVTNDNWWYYWKTPASIVIKPSTQYKFSYRIKTQYVSGDALAGTLWWIWLSDNNGVSKWEYTPCTYIKTTVGWSYCTVNFTTTADTTLAHIQMRLYWINWAATLIMKAWYDEIKLEEIWLVMPALNVSTPTGWELCLWKWCTTKKNWLSTDTVWLTCKQIKTDYPNSLDWVYWIRPSSIQPAFQAYCDMTTDWGWWTIVYQNLFTWNAGWPNSMNISYSGWNVWYQQNFSLDVKNIFAKINATSILVKEDANWIKFNNTTLPIFNKIFDNSISDASQNSYNVTSMNGTTYTIVDWLHPRWGWVEQFAINATNANTIFEYNMLTTWQDVNHYWHIWPSANWTYASLAWVTGNRWWAIWLR
jgi:hypothetical protein